MSYDQHYALRCLWSPATKVQVSIMSAIIVSVTFVASKICEYKMLIPISCSLACSRAHKETHASDKTHETSRSVDAVSMSVTDADSLLPVTSDSTPQESFEQLAACAELQALTLKYPSLRARLINLYSRLDDAEQHTSHHERHSSNYRGRHNHSAAPRRKTGEQIALETLSATQKGNAQDDEGLAEFSRLVLLKCSRSSRPARPSHQPTAARGLILGVP